MVYKCEAFIEKAKAKVAEADPDSSKRTLLAVIEFVVTVDGKQVKNFTIDLKKLEVYEGSYKGGKPCVTVTVDDDSVEKLMKKEVTLDEVKASGKLVTVGDAEVIAKFRSYAFTKLTG